MGSANFSSSDAEEPRDSKKKVVCVLFVCFIACNAYTAVLHLLQSRGLELYGLTAGPSASPDTALYSEL